MPSEQPGYDPTYPIHNKPNIGPKSPTRPSSPSPGYGESFKQSSFTEENGDRSNLKKKWNDVDALAKFILQCSWFMVVSAIVLKEWVKQSGIGRGGEGVVSNGQNITLNQFTAFLLLYISATGLILASIYLMLVRTFTKMIIHITLKLSILLNLGICIYFWFTKYYFGAIIFTIITLLSFLCYSRARSRDPFTTLLLQVAMDVANHHKPVYVGVVVVASLFFQVALSVLFSFVSLGTYAKWTPGYPSCTTKRGDTSCSDATVAVLLFFEVYSYLWISQVIANVAFTTLSGGVFGNWYFSGLNDVDNTPKHPTLTAFRRALTFSLGSIVFGSLIGTLLGLLKVVSNAGRQRAPTSGDAAEARFPSPCGWVVRYIESILKYVSRHAYVEIALYGKPYIAAARDTRRLFRDRGIDALVNDSQVGMTLMWGAHAVGLCCSFLGYSYLRLVHPSYNAGGQYTTPVVLFAFVNGLICTLTLMTYIEAGVSTIFFGLGEDPQVLANLAPELFDVIRQNYPQAVRKV